MSGQQRLRHTRSVVEPKQKQGFCDEPMPEAAVRMHRTL